MNRLLEYLPDIYHEIIDFVELTKTEEQEFISVEQAIDRLLDNQFVLTSDEFGVKRREKILKIQADPEVESLDFRKKRIINRYTTKPPFTIRYLQNQLDFLVGEGLAIASVDVHNFILNVTTTIDNASVFKELHHTINKVKPANLIYQQETALKDEVIFKERITRQSLTRDMRLSTTWRLGKTPFSIVGEEVIVK